MDAIVRKFTSAFVLNLGDNFYECGIDTPLRVWYDWGNIYTRGDKTPDLAPLTWYAPRMHAASHRAWQALRPLCPVPPMIYAGTRSSVGGCAGRL